VTEQTTDTTERDDSPPGTIRDGYAFPAYDGRCFARVPGTVGAALDADVGRSLPAELIPDGDFENVVVLLIDGFGWDRFQARRETVPLLDGLDDAGETTRITSVYPTETAAAITTMHTGRTPSEHGLLGWNLYLPEQDLTCQTLPFRTRSADGVDGEERDLGEATADATGGAVTGRDLFDGDSLYERLAAEGVESHTIQPSRVVGGSYGGLAAAGSESHGVDSVAEFALTLRRQLESSDGKRYVYAYWPDVDGASHDEGTESALYDAELSAVCGAVERELEKLDDATAEETLLLLTADHGHLNADPAEAVDLETIPEIWDNLATHDDGRPVLPTGGPRNLHLHLEPGTEETVRAAISEADFEARVLTGTEAIESELFGPGEVSPKLRERIGDLVIVPKDVNLWIGREQRKLDFVGTHGGQHTDEMYVPFLAAPLAEYDSE
jgi:predicted AlkP superfamily pyrophosphatase or phosphodiesterase